MQGLLHYTVNICMINTVYGINVRMSSLCINR